MLPAQKVQLYLYDSLLLANLPTYCVSYNPVKVGVYLTCTLGITDTLSIDVCAPLLANVIKFLYVLLKNSLLFAYINYFFLICLQIFKNMNQNYSLKYIRREKLLESLALLDSDVDRLNLLVDRYMNLQDTLFELQVSYVEVCLNLKKLSESCVQVPF